MHYPSICHLTGPVPAPKASARKIHLLFVPVVLLGVVADVETQTVGVEVDLVVALLEDLSNGLCVVELAQVDVRAALLDGVTDELGGAGLTLGADDHGLLLLPGLVDDEGGALGVLLGDLLGFDCGGEFGGEGEVLRVVSVCYTRVVWTVRDDIRLMRHHPTGC
jgi:hypothetical protein